MRSRGFGLAAALALAAPLSLHAQQAPTLEELFEYESVGSAQLSPDGSAILYTLRSMDLEENESDTDIWMASTRPGETPLRMTTNPRADSRPLWDPAGERFAFTSSRGTGDNARTALYLMSARGGEAWELYRHETNIGSFAWSPDGDWIVFAASEQDSEDDQKAQEAGRDVAIEDGPATHTHLWLLDVEAKTARRVTGTDDVMATTVSSFDWAPDGRRIVFAAAPSTNPTESWQSDLYVIATDSGAVADRLTTNPGSDTGPVWSDDGRWIYYQGYEDDAYRVGQSRLFRIAAHGGTPQDVTPLLPIGESELDLDAGDLFPTASGVWFSATTGTSSGLFWIPLDDRASDWTRESAPRAVRITPDDGVYGSFTFSDDMTRIAYVHQSPSRPEELYTAMLATRSMPPRPMTPVALTTHNTEMAKYAVGRTEVVQWQSTDGRTVEGVLVLPQSYREGRQVPLVVKIHGGPAGVYQQNFQANGHGNNAQWYAADGYAMLMPNPRGSSGYGDDGQRSVIEDWGGLDFQDIMTGVDHLIERGVAHPDSLGVMGWSYGGYMTAWTVTQTDRFKAAVNGAGITEPVAMWGTQDIIQVFEGYFGGSPFEDGRWEVYQKSSPLSHVRNAKTPTLMIHGRNDPRVPPNQAMIFYRALRALDVPTELVWLPRTGHGPSEPGLQYETALRQKQWMDRWIRGDAPAAEPVTN